MKPRILLIGAGLSTPIFVREVSRKEYPLQIVDQDPGNVSQRLSFLPPGTRVNLWKEDVRHPSSRLHHLIQEADIVVSMVPPTYHKHVLRICIQEKKPFVCASYVRSIPSELLEQACRQIPVILECGLDPGLDHLLLAEELKRFPSGTQVQRIFSAAGALPHPRWVREDPNPWKYRFTWAPSQVVRAGKSSPVWLQDGKFVPFPSQQVFQSVRPLKTSLLDPWLKSLRLEYYPNGDVRPYLNGLPDSLHTFIRASLRYEGFARAWNFLVQSGLTADSPLFRKELPAELLLQACLRSAIQKDPVLKDEYPRIRPYLTFLNLDPADAPFSCEERQDLQVFNGKNGKGCSPIQLLEEVLRKRWMMPSGAMDMVAMYLEVEARDSRKIYRRETALWIEGVFPERSAVAQGVGYMLFWAVDALVQEKLSLPPGIYTPWHPWLHAHLWASMQKNEFFRIRKKEESHEVSSGEIP